MLKITMQALVFRKITFKKNLEYNILKFLHNPNITRFVCVEVIYCLVQIPFCSQQVPSHYICIYYFHHTPNFSCASELDSVMYNIVQHL